MSAKLSKWLHVFAVVLGAAIASPTLRDNPKAAPYIEIGTILVLAINAAGATDAHGRDTDGDGKPDA